jgi:hypothetical protein
MAGADSMDTHGRDTSHHPWTCISCESLTSDTYSDGATLPLTAGPGVLRHTGMCGFHQMRLMARCVWCARDN